MIRNTLTTILLFFLFVGCNNSSIEKPNILLIMVDDLNDYNEDLNGHPQVITPNIKEFSKTATSFINAYSNDPMCGPSRASMFTGVYPHISSHLWQYNWKNNEI